MGTQAAQKQVKIIAHRGASAVEPENTLCAFQRAITMGADMIELDVQRSADGIAVVIHDQDLQRVAGRDAWVADLPLRDLKTLNVGQGERIPTLDEALDLIRQSNIEVNIEIKAPAMETAVVRAIRTAGVVERTIVSSFEARFLLRLREFDPQIRRAYLMGTETWRPDVRLREALPLPSLWRIGAAAWNPHYRLLTPLLAAALRLAGFSLYVWTVDDPVEMRRLIDLRVDGIITNVPNVLQAILAEINNHESGTETGAVHPALSMCDTEKRGS